MTDKETSEMITITDDSLEWDFDTESYFGDISLNYDINEERVIGGWKEVKVGWNRKIEICENCGGEIRDGECLYCGQEPYDDENE